MNPNRVTGRGWAYLGALLGGAVSIAANVAHSYVPPTDAPADWSPPTGAVVGAIFWPVSLFVAVEILARVRWPNGTRWSLLRFGGMVPVAAVAALVSYRHLSGLLTFYGEDGMIAALGPLAVDGLMVMATGALLATGARASATAPAVAEPAAVPAPPVVTPPVVTPETAAPAPAPTAQADAPKPAPAVKRPARPQVKRRPASADKVAKVAAKMPGATVAEIAAKAGVSESTARRYLPTRTTDRDATVTPATPMRPAATPALADAA